MSGYGFGAKKTPDAPATAKIDLGGLPTALPPLTQQAEAKAVAAGEGLGFVDRGQGGARRQRPAPVPTASLYVKGPQELIDWFITYTDGQGHSAYWKSLQDFRNIVDGDRR